MFDHAREFDELKRSEEELLKYFRSLPEEWFLSEDIVQRLEKIETTLDTVLKHVEKSKSALILEKVNQNFQELLTKVRRHVILTNQLLKKIKANKLSRSIPENLKESMHLLLDTLHKLLFYISLYPIDKIGKRKVLKEILAGLRKGNYLPPDVNQIEASSMISRFISEELILAIQFNTSEKPYLMISLDPVTKKITLHILKKSSMNTQVVISKLMNLLSLNHMVIDSKHRLVNDKPEDLNRISFIQGIPLVEMPRLNNPRKILPFTFMLGAACADAFVLNLADRWFNIHIDLREFEKSWGKSLVHFLGEGNPIFHIDYEFLKSTDITHYLSGQLFGPQGLFLSLFVDNIDLIKAGLSQQEVVAAFNNGFLRELSYIEESYSKNQEEVDALLVKNNITYLRERFNPESYQHFIALQSRFLDELRIRNSRAA